MPEGLAELVIGGADRAVQLADDPRIPLVSATGSTQMGKELAPRIAARLGRSLLELGGNNAAIVAPSADLDLVVRGVLFSAVGTAGQRCTSLRRLIVHESIADEVVEPARAPRTESVPIGDPREPGTLVGPLVSGDSFARLEEALAEARADGGEVVAGGERALAEELPGRVVREPDARPHAGADRGRRARDVRAAPLRAHVLRAGRGDRAPERRPAGARLVDLHDRPARGRALPRRAPAPTAGSRTSTSARAAPRSAAPSAARRRRAAAASPGSDAWKAYMRRQTATVNFTSELPLAQGIVFDVP